MLFLTQNPFSTDSLFETVSKTQLGLVDAIDASLPEAFTKVKTPDLLDRYTTLHMMHHIPLRKGFLLATRAYGKAQTEKAMAIQENAWCEKKLVWLKRK